ncbi:hypothetical protein E6H33_11180 [Candidatus Bathyarchaeota archaeon]|nr:MAG: hypothetical protein E6H33_11180 [Candidatus Bathyarchaeota archaeon]
MTDKVPSGLSCSPISPSAVTGYGTASLSFKSTIPGTFNVMVTASSGPTSHTATKTIIMTPAPSRNTQRPRKHLRTSTRNILLDTRNSHDHHRTDWRFPILEVQI